jgi:hypothetical protein
VTPPPLIAPAGDGDGSGGADADAGAGTPERALTADVDAVAFGTAVIGQSVPARLTLSSSGDVALSISVTLVGDAAADFAILPGGCTSELDPGGSCTLSLQLTPSVAGPRAAQLEVVVSDGTSISVALSGEGVAPGALTSDNSGFDEIDQFDGRTELSLVTG